MQNIINISELKKTYSSGFTALDNINLTIKQGEIFALLGPNAPLAGQIPPSLARSNSPT